MLIKTVKTGCGRQLRTEPRAKVLLSGRLSGRRGRTGCRVVDISRGGACLDADQPHEIGETVNLERGRLNVSGTIAWSRGSRFGVRFEKPIRATELLVQMSQSRQASPPSPLSAVASCLSPSR